MKALTQRKHSHPIRTVHPSPRQAPFGRLRASGTGDRLTSITTIAGLTPLMFETSFQAQFLIPMAISIVFGLAFATVLTLVLVPTLYLVLEDIGRNIKGTVRWIWGTA